LADGAATVSRFIKLSFGALLGHHAVFSTNTSLGKYVQCNPQTLVPQDCEISDFVTFGSAAIYNISVSIGNFVYIELVAVIC